jgi:hypothetical protein
MKKVGSSFKKVGAIFLGIVLLFLLFNVFSGSREGFYGGCVLGQKCTPKGATCQKTDREGNVTTNICVRNTWKPQQA